MAQLNGPQLRALALSVGIPGGMADVAAAVALCESSGITDKPGDGGASIGLWQIHTPSHPWADKAKLKDPLYNAQAMARISVGGTYWRPWTMYRNGCYKKHLPISGSLDPTDIPGAGIVGGAVDAAQESIGGITSLVKIAGDTLGTLLDPEWWKRLGVGAAGLVVLLLAGAYLVRSLVIPDVGKLVKNATGGS